MSKKFDETNEDAVAHSTELLNSSVLREMVASLNETKLKLLLTIKDLKQQLSQQKEDQADIYYYLNKKCDDSYEVIASLEQQLLAEQTDREQSEKGLEKRFQEMLSQYQLIEARLQSKVRELEDRIFTMQEYNDGKEERAKALDELMKTLESERSQFSSNIGEMERRWLVEREKLRKDYDHKIHMIRAEVAVKVEEKLSVKSKKTQLLNISLKKELKYQSSQAEKVLEVNQSTIDNDRDLRLELQLAQSAEKEMVSKLAMYQRLNKQLNDQVELQAAQSQNIEDQYKLDTDAKNSEIDKLNARLENYATHRSKNGVKMDEMWGFLTKEYHRLISVGGKDDSVNVILKNDDVAIESHDFIVTKLVDALLARYPQRYEHFIRMMHQKHPNPASRDDKLQDMFQRPSSSSSAGQLPPVAGALLTTSSSRASNRTGPGTKSSAFSNGGGHNVGKPDTRYLTGIASWDLFSAEDDSAIKSIGTQTDPAITTSNITAGSAQILNKVRSTLAESPSQDDWSSQLASMFAAMQTSSGTSYISHDNNSLSTMQEAQSLPVPSGGGGGRFKSSKWYSSSAAQGAGGGGAGDGTGSLTSDELQSCSLSVTKSLTAAEPLGRSARPGARVRNVRTIQDFSPTKPPQSLVNPNQFRSVDESAENKELYKRRNLRAKRHITEPNSYGPSSSSKSNQQTSAVMSICGQSFTGTTNSNSSATSANDTHTNSHGNTTDVLLNNNMRKQLQSRGASGGRYSNMTEGPGGGGPGGDMASLVSDLTSVTHVAPGSSSSQGGGGGSGGGLAVPKLIIIRTGTGERAHDGLNEANDMPMSPQSSISISPRLEAFN